MPGPGQIHVFEQNSHMIRARLSHFDLASAHLKPEHTAWLARHALGFLARGGSLRVIGLASRSGDMAFNQALSRRRADAVINYLRTREHKSFKVARNDALGEEAARIAGLPNGHEDGRWRSVILSVWDRPEPPPPPPRQPPAAPQMVSRRSFARIITREVTTSPFMDDADRRAEVIADMGNAAAQTVGAAQRIIEERQSRVPDNFSLQEIRLEHSRNNVSVLGGLGGVQMEYCDITYRWGAGHAPVRMVDNYDSAYRRNGMISQADAQLWLTEPGTSFRRRRI